MQTSNLIAYAVPVFTFMILCEFLYGYLRKRNNYRLNDTVTSIGLGLMSRYPTQYHFPKLLVLHAQQCDHLNKMH